MRGRPALALVLGLAACVSGAASARTAPAAGCTPTEGLGSIALLRGKVERVVDLGTCRVHLASRGPRAESLRSPDGRLVAAVRVTGRAGRLTERNTIWVTDTRTQAARRLFSTRLVADTIGLESPGPIRLLGWSGDSRWIVFTIDPGGSGSIAADGLIPRVLSAADGSVHRLPVMLPYPDYIAWCGGELVFAAGPDRVATNRKRLLAASPPDWRPRLLVHSSRRAWGSVACAPDNRSVVVQSQAQNDNGSFFASRWALWRFGLDGSQRRLTSPSAGNADESPRFSRDGSTLLFVRSQHGVGRLYAARDGRVLGPLLDLGTLLGFYGHRDWWQTMDWSLGARPSV